MRRGWLLLVPFVIVALGGCGEQSDEERADERRDSALTAWDNREGAAWTAYEKGWDAGWSDGCYEADRRLHPTSPDADPGCSPGPGFPGYESLPTYPPDSPEEEGREDGFESGCTAKYIEDRDDVPPPDFCARLALRSNAMQRAIDAYCEQNGPGGFLPCPAKP
jgi:hypothetical protein